MNVLRREHLIGSNCTNVTHQTERDTSTHILSTHMHCGTHSWVHFCADVRSDAVKLTENQANYLKLERGKGGGKRRPNHRLIL